MEASNYECSKRKPARSPPIETGTSPVPITTNERQKSVNAESSQTKPRIQAVTDLLRNRPDSAELFEPRVVAIGPFHASNPHLKPMEKHKIAAAEKFTSQQTTDQQLELFMKEQFRHAALAARFSYYPLPEIDDEEFVNMMFIDGCFLLHFIDRSLTNKTEELSMPVHLHGFIMKDMFLLENQLPMEVLESLMSGLKRVDLKKFVAKIIGEESGPSQPTSPSVQGRPELPAAPKHVADGLIELEAGTAIKGAPSATATPSSPRKPKQPAPVHLLDLLRTEILGEAEPPCPTSRKWDTFRSIMELKEVGINLAASTSRQLRSIQLERGWVYSTLSLPPFIVDDLTRSRLLNLIAFEMCPDVRSDYGITSYVWFIDRLIDVPGDVKELRSEKILLNALGSDEQVAELFNGLTKDLSPDFKAYQSVTNGIRSHCDSKIRVYVVGGLHTHFSTPWAIIGFCAAAFLLLLSMVQTIFTVVPLDKMMKKKH